MKLKVWFHELTRPQAILFGGISGFALGLTSGLIMRFLLTILILVFFILVVKNIENHFEARLGIIGLVAVVVASSTLGPVKNWLTGSLGGMFTHAPTGGMALIGAFLALQLHSASIESADTESDFLD